MILVRTTFHAKFGQAGRLVQMFTDVATMPESMRLPTRVLTDLSGPFDTVVLEQVVESIDDFQRRMREMFTASPGGAESNPMIEIVASGHREYYTIEAEH